MKPEAVRELVKKLREQKSECDEADLFPVWFLQHAYEVPLLTAVKQSSLPDDVGTANNDHGVDAYCLTKTNAGREKLVLIQAKYSDSLSLVKQAFSGFEKALPEIQRIMARSDAGATLHNKIFYNLRKDLLSLTDEQLGDLQFDFKVVHLLDVDNSVVYSKTEAVREWNSPGFLDTRQG